jgi:hypothetical protein
MVVLLYQRPYNSAANNFNNGGNYGSIKRQRAENDEAPQGGNRPSPSLNTAALNCPSGRTRRRKAPPCSNTTISNSYKDDKSGEWKQTSSFSPTDLLVVGELSPQAFAEIAKLKQQGRGC